jgi:hypothetical protein
MGYQSGIYSIKNNKVISISNGPLFEKRLAQLKLISKQTMKGTQIFKDNDGVLCFEMESSFIYFVFYNDGDLKTHTSTRIIKTIKNKHLNNNLNNNNNNKKKTKYGLYSNDVDDNITILNTKIRVKITEGIALVKIIQEYNILEKDEDELKYSFPIDELSSIYSFKVFIKNDNLKTNEEIIGKIYEKESAKKKYEKEINNNKTAVLLELEEENEDLFQLSLGNFKKYDNIKIEIKYVTELIKNSEKEYRFYLPKEISNKYGMSSSNKTISYEINFSAKIKMETKIIDIKSYGYEIESKINDDDDNTSAKVTFNSNILDVDSFYLIIKLKEKSKVKNLVGLKKSDNTLSIMSILPSSMFSNYINKESKKKLGKKKNNNLNF